MRAVDVAVEHVERRSHRVSHAERCWVDNWVWPFYTLLGAEQLYKKVLGVGVEVQMQE